MMRTKEDIRNTIATLLSDIRAKYGYSKSKIADYLGIDRHTWIRWEAGASSPTLEDLIMIFDKLEEPLLPSLLDIMYPSNESSITSPINDIRKQAAIAFLEEESEHHVRIWQYMMNVLTRTELNAQVEELCAIDHLPLHFRYFLAEQAYFYYMTALKDKQLINTDQVMPDMDTFTAGLIRTQKAAFDKLK